MNGRSHHKLISVTHYYVRGWSIAPGLLNNYSIGITNLYDQHHKKASSHFPHKNQTLPLCDIMNSKQHKNIFHKFHIRAENLTFINIIT